MLSNFSFVDSDTFTIAHCWYVDAYCIAIRTLQLESASPQADKSHLEDIGMVRISNFHQNLHIFRQTAPYIDRDCQLG